MLHIIMLNLRSVPSTGASHCYLNPYDLPVIASVMGFLQKLLCCFLFPFFELSLRSFH